MSVPLAVVLILVILFVLLGLFIYWLIFLTEGAFLGERVVVWLYDLYAGRYDKIKDWVDDDEIYYLAEPFANDIGPLRQPPLILDVAAGTAALTRATRKAGLLPDSTWVLLDASAKMLDQGKAHLGTDPAIYFLQHSAQILPFDDDTFDVVACLEALEFFPKPEGALVELIRVLRPGGLLFTTNRVGTISAMMPGKTWSGSQVFRLHKELGQRHISIRPYLVDYEWVNSVKAGRYTPPGRAQDKTILDMLATCIE